MKYYYILAALMLCAGCKKEKDEPNIEYLTFGKANGLCWTECATFFKVEDNAVYADSMMNYTGTLQFQSDALANDKYLLAKPLQDNFPTYLTDNPNQTIGCPDCADQGGIYITRKVNGITSYWNIDTQTGAQPLEIRAYLQQMVSVIDSLDQ